MTAESAKGCIETVIHYDLDKKIQQVCHTAIESPMFTVVPASIGKHHGYEGGLAIHTWEVLNGCLGAARHYGADRNILVPAAIWHDIAKVAEYERCPVDDEHPIGWRSTDFKSKIYHISGGFADWVWTAQRVGLDYDYYMKVGHCILSHHGRREWGSPVEPQTPEAAILHFADSFSASYGAAKDGPPA